MKKGNGKRWNFLIYANYYVLYQCLEYLMTVSFGVGDDKGESPELHLLGGVVRTVSKDSHPH